jgi:hypothetical protein
VPSNLKRFLMINFLAAFPAVWSLNAQESPASLIYHSCQGEGCGCAASPVVQKETPLYAEMKTNSKVTGVLKKGQKARVLESYTIVKKPGRAKVTKVENSSLGLQKGDEIQLILYKGEGAWLVWHKEKELELDETADASWRVIEQPRNESWYKLGTENLEGYTQNFPFQGCLE